MASLDRFRDAQDAPHGGYADALRELQAGRKSTHWIWYVFPQLAGLAQSAVGVHYGLTGFDEAADYLRDPVLGARLVEAAAAVRAHLCEGTRLRPDRLMGSEIDAVKLVSSMTLFAQVARMLNARNPQPRFAAMDEHAEAILGAVAAQGYERCAYTESRMRETIASTALGRPLRRPPTP